MTKSPASIATDIIGTYVKNESMSFHTARNKLYRFLYNSQFQYQYHSALHRSGQSFF